MTSQTLGVPSTLQKREKRSRSNGRTPFRLPSRKTLPVDAGGFRPYFGRMNRLLALASLIVTISASIAADSPKVFPVGGLNFQRPESWGWVETRSPMRKAQLSVPGSDAKSGGEVVFFHFGPGNGGGVQANVDRWLGQFEEKGPALMSKVETVKVRNQDLTLVRAQGTYLSGMPGGPKTPQPDTLLLGAIVPGPEGAVFIRFTGPSAVGKTAEAAFRKMAEGAIEAK